MRSLDAGADGSAELVVAGHAVLTGAPYGVAPVRGVLRFDPTRRRFVIRALEGPVEFAGVTR